MNKEWSVSEDGRLIFSDDFTHDVTLKVDGDFEDDAQRKAYAEKLAEKLNGTHTEKSIDTLLRENVSRTPEQRAALLVKSKILDEKGDYVSEFFRDETVRKNKERASGG